MEDIWEFLWEKYGSIMEEICKFDERNMAIFMGEIWGFVGEIWEF